MSSIGKHKGRDVSVKLPAAERIKSKKIIEELFSKGSFSALYPFRLIYLINPEYSSDFPQVIFSVPKRNFKKAVDRNRIRRQMREIYRLNKSKIFPQADLDKKRQIPSYLAIIFTGKEKINYDDMEKKLILILKRLKLT
ncbi:MAG: ribonuclease P protein component [Cytophagaceae bacterium]